MNLKDRLLVFIYHKMNELEADRKTVHQKIRYQPMDSLDMYETMRADIRLEAWEEYIDQLFKVVMYTGKN